MNTDFLSNVPLADQLNCIVQYTETLAHVHVISDYTLTIHPLTFWLDTEAERFSATFIFRMFKDGIFVGATEYTPEESLGHSISNSPSNKVVQFILISAFSTLGNVIPSLFGITKENVLHLTNVNVSRFFNFLGDITEGSLTFSHLSDATLRPLNHSLIRENTLSVAINNLCVGTKYFTETQVVPASFAWFVDILRNVYPHHVTTHNDGLILKTSYPFVFIPHTEDTYILSNQTKL